jgi:GxxExxY protein
MERTSEPGAVLDTLAHDVLGAALEVHRALGPGFPESVYENALCLELSERGISFTRQSPVHIIYKGQSVGEGRIDLLISDQLVVELKAVDALAPVHTAQVLAYLKATGRRLGLLINFNGSTLVAGIRRVVLTR